jgi:transposase
MRSQGTAKELEARRKLAVERVLAGYKQREVAAFLGVSEGTINHWMQACLRAGGMKGIQAKPTPGRPRKLSARQERTALGWVAKPPTKFGFPTDLWTSRRLAALIEQRWGIHFNSNSLVEWLRAHEQSPQKPDQPAKERNKAAIAKWLAEDWPRLQKKARAEGARLVLIDESGFFLNPLVRRTWALKGKTPVLHSFGCHRDKVSVIAALSVAPLLRRVGLYFRTDPKNYIDAEAVVSFRRELLKHLRGRVIVVWDRGSNHKGPLIRAFCSRFPRLHLEPLPAYAPELNPVEFVWSHLKYARMTNFVPEGVHHLDQVVQTHLREVGQTPGLLKALWHGSKLPFPKSVFTY